MKSKILNRKCSERGEKTNIDKFFEVDIINVFLCFSVILIHITAKYCVNMIFDSPSKCIVFIINKMLCFVVPAFIALSGFKLMQKYKNKNLNIKEFYKNRLRKIVIPYFISVGGYMLYYLFKGMFEISLKNILSAFLLGDMVGHFYYVIIAIQFYLIFPILIKSIKKYPKITTLIAATSTIAFKNYIVFNYSDRFMGAYILFFVFGMLIAKNYEAMKAFLNKNNTYIILPFFVISIYHVWKTFAWLRYREPYNFAEIVNIIYSILAIIILFFAGIRAKMTIQKKEKVERFVEKLNKQSLYIYLYHVLILQILQFEILPKVTFLTPGMELIVTTVIMYSLSIMYSYMRFHKFNS